MGCLDIKTTDPKNKPVKKCFALRTTGDTVSDRVLELMVEKLRHLKSKVSGTASSAVLWFRGKSH